MAEHKCQVIQSIRKAQPQARKAISRPERSKPGQKETNGPFLVMCLYFWNTRVGVARR